MSRSVGQALPGEILPQGCSRGNALPWANIRAMFRRAVMINTDANLNESRIQRARSYNQAAQFDAGLTASATALVYAFPTIVDCSFKAINSDAQNSV